MRSRNNSGARLQRIGRDGAGANTPEMQGLASVVLAPPPVAPRPTSGLTPEQAAIATRVLGALPGTQR